MLRIGVDVGGTNTDGVLIDITKSSEKNRGVLAYHKAPTTPNVSDGIENAVRQVLETSGISPSQITCLSIGTTAFINAVLEADSRRLAKVAVIRLCGPYTQQCPPFMDFPENLKKLTLGHISYVDGGLQIDGSEITTLKEDQIVHACKAIKEQGLNNVVISGIFSPLDHTGIHEETAKAIVRRELGARVNIVCSRDVAQMGLLERENASILNASILTFAKRTISGFQRAMKALNLKCPLFLTQNDGTLTSASAAANLPIRTFASGPTNSMRGAAFLAGLDDRSGQDAAKSTIVVDIGGTTTDVGVLLPSGFPRQAAAFIEVGGVRTNFSMADVQSIGLGGGSRIQVTEESSGRSVAVGPESVGHRITSEAKIFGGQVLTASDIVVAGGHAQLGDSSLVSDIGPDIVAESIAAIKRKLESIIDKMKTSPEDVTLLLVGGGSIISPNHIVGVGNIVRPPYFSVANAVGAAMAKVAGEIDTIEILQGRKINEVIDKIKEKAIEKAISSGAAPESVKIVEVANLPVQYVTNQATRIVVKAAGELSETYAPSNDTDDALEDEVDDMDAIVLGQDTKRTIAAEQPLDILSYRPQIRPDKSWRLSEVDLEWIAEGCGILGTGGGGSPYPPFLVAREQLRSGQEIIVVDADYLPEDSIFVRCCFMGSPSVSNERLQGGNELPTAIRELLKYIGATDFTGAISDEIGGGNGIQPMIIAAEMGKPVLDADLMGRAYPNMYQSLPGAYKIPGGLTPCAISDGSGNTIIMPTSKDVFAVENVLRAVTTEMGSRSGVSMSPLKVGTCRDYGILRTVSQAWRIGRAIALAKKRNDMKSIPSEILKLQNGRCLFVGKIVDVQREVRKGFTWGAVTIAPLRKEEEEENSITSSAYGPDDHLIIPFQNENLYAYTEAAGVKKILVTVPDLITVLDSQSGSSLGTHEYRYGLRVTVIAMAGDPKWTKTQEGLACGGPSAFGLDIPFTPIAEYVPPRSVIAEYS